MVLRQWGEFSVKKKEIHIIINTAYSNYKDNFMSWAADVNIVKSSDLSELKNAVKEVLVKKAKDS